MNSCFYLAVYFEKVCLAPVGPAEAVLPTLFILCATLQKLKTSKVRSY